MSHIFEDREKQFEAKYKHDEELRFKVAVRRDKLLGLWAAKQLGITDADAYARSVIEADLEKPGDEDVIEKLLTDFKARGIEMSGHRIRTQMAACFEEARQQIMKEVK